MVCVYNLLVSSSALAIILLSGPIHSISPSTLVLGILFGGLNACSIIAKTAALANGPMSLSLLIGCCGMLIPTFSGVLFWDEALDGFCILGVVLMVLSMVLIMDVCFERALSLRWAGFAALFFLCTGLISVMQKIQQSTDAAHERTGFLCVAFSVSILVNAGRLIPKLRRTEKKERMAPRQLISGIISGGCAGINNILNLYLSGVIPAMIFFPLVNGGSILLAGVVGCLLFRERISRKQLMGFVIGIASILLISGLFG